MKRLRLLINFHLQLMLEAYEVFWGMLDSIGNSLNDFSKIAKPLSNLLNKDVVFVFNDDCLEAFNILKAKLVSAPMIMMAPHCSYFLCIYVSRKFSMGSFLTEKRTGPSSI